MLQLKINSTVAATGSSRVWVQQGVDEIISRPAVMM
jgi:hypothetical protein